MRVLFGLCLAILVFGCAPHKQQKTNPDWIGENAIEKPSDSIVKKYTSYLKVPYDSVKNESLYHHIDEWIGAPYLLGGDTQEGVDCSALVQNLYVKAYQTLVPRTSETQFESRRVYLFRNPKYLKEGDLVFFRLKRSAPISHVGIYLHNNKFVHATSHKGKANRSGVKISDLTDPHWNSLYVSGGRVKKESTKVSAK